MRRTPKPDRDSDSGRIDSWGPGTTRTVNWGAVALIAAALVWALLAPNAEVGPRSSGPRATSEVVPEPSEVVTPEPDCTVAARPQQAPPDGFAAVSTSVVGRGTIRESIRWAGTSREGLWGVSAVAECDAVRLDAVWVEPTGQRRRHTVSQSGQPVIGVVADGGDGAISVYTVWGSSQSVSAVLHISTDGGATWQERAVPPSGEPHVRAGVLPPNWREWNVLAN